MLEECGYEVVGEAKNGKEAVDEYAKLKPDLVTMDITMPEMNGVEALRLIRQMDPTAKVIICSAMGQRDMVLDAISSGARDFVVKPFQKDRIQEAVAKVLS